MMRSLFAGVSGLKAHQTRMDVIGNNIANVNTVAYKSSSMTFAALMSQTTQRASGANASTGTGGVNPRQIGLGVKTSAINVNITGQGASQSTGNPFDIMITGENFFIVNNGQENYFTRDGSFYVDGAGNLAMTSIGYSVMGWQVDEETGAIKKDSVSALRIMNTANMNYPPEATTQGYMSGILDKLDTDVTSSSGKVVNFQFYDDLGYSYNAKFVFKQSETDAKNEYSLELDKITDSDGKEVEMTAEQKAAVFGQTQTQAQSGRVALGKGYKWENGVLKDADGKELASLTAIQGDTAYKPTNPADAEEISVEQQLDNIAKAYGYKGSTEDFLSKIYEVTPANPDATPPVEAVTCTIRDMIYGENDSNNAKAPTLDSLVNTGTGTTDEGFETTGREFTGVIVKYNAKNGTFERVEGGKVAEGGDVPSVITLNLSGIGNGNFKDIDIDLSSTTNVGNKGTSTIGATNGADDEFSTGSGRRNGVLKGLSVQQNGMIYGTYDNGMTKLLGQIATAKFANASGLEKLADNLYAATLNSGSFDGIGVDITAEGDYMSTGQLEMSNVDLSSEFTEMITTQRGFQANSRIITVSDTLLEELTNLKR
ncbi:MAG: flagellar hook-basal body complex protein [Lachnospiraceae bacterium]|nr:flagellar hook-basal body complex protein [Lachnospiraceae bacterium]